MAGKGNSKSNISKYQRNKLDRILNETPRKAWNNNETFEKIFTETLSVFNNKENGAQPNLVARKRKGNANESEVDNTEQPITQENKEEAWIIPNKTAKLKNNIDQASTSDEMEHNHNNIYEHLLNTQEDDDEINKGKTENQPKVSTKRPPPIHASGITIGDFIKLTVKDGITKNKFHIKQQLDDKIIIFAHEFIEYETIKTTLVSNGTQFFTFTPKHLRPKSIILKGIKGNVTQDEIKAELSEKEENKYQIMKVVKINYNREDTNRYHFLVQVTHQSSLKDLTSIKYVAYQKARWERPKKRAILQCKKCQRLGHVSYNCNFKPIGVSNVQNHTK
ncbi:hypothetical protein PV325_009913 [Microctonus aethiopoides]|nr:hypothetical protein PV325_009913 [Microctonus aethiopoides]